MLPGFSDSQSGEELPGGLMVTGRALHKRAGTPTPNDTACVGPPASQDGEGALAGCLHVVVRIVEGCHWRDCCGHRYVPALSPGRRIYELALCLCICVQVRLGDVSRGGRLGKALAGRRTVLGNQLAEACMFIHAPCLHQAWRGFFEYRVSRCQASRPEQMQPLDRVVQQWQLVVHPAVVQHNPSSLASPTKARFH